MISARVCVSRFPSQAPPVSFINVLVLLASLAGSVVAAFGVLLSVLETRLGITSGMHHTERVHQRTDTSGRSSSPKHKTIYV
jgi:hypothetical protein